MSLVGASPDAVFVDGAFVGLTGEVCKFQQQFLCSQEGDHDRDNTREVRPPPISLMLVSQAFEPCPAANDALTMSSMHCRRSPGAGGEQVTACDGGSGVRPALCGCGGLPRDYAEAGRHDRQVRKILERSDAT